MPVDVEAKVSRATARIQAIRLDQDHIQDLPHQCHGNEISDEEVLRDRQHYVGTLPKGMVHETAELSAGDFLEYVLENLMSVIVSGC